MKAPPAVESALWLRLEAEARSRARRNEPAHDFFHVERVVSNALSIARGEGVSAEIEGAAATAALLHELYTLPKDHPDSARAGDRCAEKARELLDCEAAPAWLAGPVCAAIRDHSFSKGVLPDAVESRLLQDADRLDAIGAIGLARMWATCADMKRPFYSPDDPFCVTRAPDDKLWGLDHVFKKLLAIPARLHTQTARKLAEQRVAFMKTYLEQLGAELTACTDR
ncbi:MAG: metal-dependent phosphohydrolase [Labilithrix sp.]|nr:metal-dependent phosphohydrolase [Labilithrix sp.]